MQLYQLQHPCYVETANETRLLLSKDLDSEHTNCKAQGVVKKRLFKAGDVFQGTFWATAARIAGV